MYYDLIVNTYKLIFVSVFTSNSLSTFMPKKKPP